jgi:hypothetical protein
MRDNVKDVPILKGYNASSAAVEHKKILEGFGGRDRQAGNLY